MFELILAIPPRERYSAVSAFYPQMNKMDIPGRKAFLYDLLAGNDLKVFRKQISKELVEIAGVKDLIPDVYSDFRQIAIDGISFILEKISEDRLKYILIDQMLLDQKVEAGERLILIAFSLPTIHKLGQIIARNSNIDISFRKWLMKLESSVPDTSSPRDFILSQMQMNRNNSVEFIIDEKPLAEASVGVVTAFTFQNSGFGLSEGVFKTVKPGVTQFLSEEIILIDQLTDFFDENRSNYPLSDFHYREVFDEIKTSLLSEVDLTVEQKNLKSASIFFDSNSSVKVPKLLPFSTEKVTAMEKINGKKIDRDSLSDSEASFFAEELFWNLFGKVIFSTNERALFHGDPHAGNIFIQQKKDGKQIYLLDWSQTGYLKKDQRCGILQIALGILTHDENRITKAALSLANDCDSLCVKKMLQEKTAQAFSVVQKDKSSSFMEKTMIIIDKLALGGCSFPGELLWFRKSFFTLRGIITELAPQLSLDEVIFKHLENYLLLEIPERISDVFIKNRSDNYSYQSLISNNDLFSLLQLGIYQGLNKSIRREINYIQTFYSSLIDLYSIPFSLSHFSASSAAQHPEPAAEIACR
ncbi:MAG: hypothetical protein HQM10_05085 [Candidatus Riflebacteria bacterium]|nr:hypothetical protein [Candidatus Riflebacteria bacterium]